MREVTVHWRFFFSSSSASFQCLLVTYISFIESKFLNAVTVKLFMQKRAGLSNAILKFELITQGNVESVGENKVGRHFKENTLQPKLTKHIRNSCLIKQFH